MKMEKHKKTADEIAINLGKQLPRASQIVLKKRNFVK